VVLLLAGLALASPAQAEETLLKLSDLIDRDLYDKNGKLVGEVEDIIVKRSGRAKKMIVEFGGFLDIADRLVGINFKRFNIGEDRVTVEMTEEQLDKQPSFDYYRRGLTPEYYYRMRPYSAPYPHRAPPYTYEPDLRRERYDHPREWAFSSPRFLASVILNRYLINTDGENIGKVEELLLDPEDNTVKNIIVSTGGLLTGSSRIELPYRPLGFSAYGLVYAVTSEELRKMPGYASGAGSE
jgi:sporulation protein YlmC with PRC-barrel domain